MRVAKLEIQNYRGIRKGEISFGKHPVLIGSNNTGKTTVIEALTLLLGRDKLIRDLSEHDFYGSNPLPADRIKLIATITDFSGNDPDRNTDWFRDGRAVPKWMDPLTGKVHSAPDSPTWTLCCQIAAQAFFDRTSLSVEFVRYFHDHDDPIDPFLDDSPTAVPTALIRQLGFFLVRTNRTWDKMLSWGSELFRRTLQTTAAQPSEAIIAERDRLRRPERPIEEDPSIAPLIERVDAEISRCIPSSPSLKLRITSTDSRSVMDAISAHFSVNEDVCLPTARQGSGLISLQGLMLLLELGRARSEAGEEFLMALEEPELHLPPATQQQIVHRVQALSSQTFVTTHSPTIAAMADPESVIFLRNNNGELISRPFLQQAVLPDSPNWKRKFFQQSRTDVLAALMHPCVLIPEGKTEFYILKIILRPLMLTDGWTSQMERPFNLEVGTVPTEEAKVVETFDELARTHQRIACLVDGDADGQRYARSLAGKEAKPYSIIAWQNNATIEDAVGWILAADEKNSVRGLNEQSESELSDIASAVAHLKSKKMDLVLYEQVADVIANNQACREQAAKLFSALCLACNNEPSNHFTNVEGIWVFQP